MARIFFIRQTLQILLRNLSSVEFLTAGWFSHSGLQSKLIIIIYNTCRHAAGKTQRTKETIGTVKVTVTLYMTPEAAREFYTLTLMSLLFGKT